MTISETANIFGVNEDTVLDWCQKNLIRGLRLNDANEYVIPSSVKRPYTGSRSKGDAIYTSIVKAILNGFDVTASLYNLSETEFEVYVSQLKEAGIIGSYVDEETKIEYFCRTLKSSDFSKLRKNRVKAFLKAAKPNVNISLGVNVVNV